MDQLQTRLDALEHHVQTFHQEIRTLTRRLRWWRGLACGLMVLGLLSLPLYDTTAQTHGAPGAQALTLEQRVAALEAKLKYLTTRIDSSGRPLMEVAGANLRLVNGQGKTQTLNGLGNLIVGYNEIRSEGNVRIGSHNIVVGEAQNYLSFGGLVVGQANEISGRFAVVSGGGGNTASGVLASISGGVSNTASGAESSVSAGDENTASGLDSVVSGGRNRTAAGDFDWVAGSLVEDD